MCGMSMVERDEKCCREWLRFSEEEALEGMVTRRVVEGWVKFHWGNRNIGSASGLKGCTSRREIYG